MSQPSNSAVRGSPTSSAPSAPLPPAAATGDYVVNLCASTTPMALAKPSAPELARYTFFVSRRREEGRERFRLHMGYFATREEAEQMLQLVRDLYPAAWVGETPGRKLGSNTAARSSAPVTPATAPGRAAAGAPSSPAAPVAAAVPQPVGPASPPPAVVASAVAPPASATVAARAAAPASALTTTLAPSPAAATPAAASPRARAAESVAPATNRAVAPPAAPRVSVPPASNVREVIAALEPEVDATMSMPRVRAPAAATDAPPPATAAPARSAPPSAAAPAAPVAAAPVAAVRSTTPGADMTDSQVLRVLEGRATAHQARADAATQEGRDIALLSPQDTQTWRDIKAQIKRDAVVHFAVQLNWSVTPIDLARVPSLAIFNAYTLYKIEGNREGRKWYGLRLGFFSDAVSAKQVAHYVRSEFAQVAVVPVGINEREQAKQIGAIALPATPPAARAAPPGDNEIKLIDDEPARPPSAVASALDEIPETSVPPARAAAAPTRAPASTARRPSRPRGAPQSLEETLEILGASQLSIDSGRGERVVIEGRARAVDAPTSTFTKLLDRLGEKLRK